MLLRMQKIEFEFTFLLYSQLLLPANHHHFSSWTSKNVTYRFDIHDMYTVKKLLVDRCVSVQVLRAKNNHIMGDFPAALI